LNMKDVISVYDAAKLSGYHSNHIRRLLQKQKIKARKWGQAWMVDKDSLLDYCKRMDAKGKRRGPKK